MCMAWEEHTVLECPSMVAGGLLIANSNPAFDCNAPNQPCQTLPILCSIRITSPASNYSAPTVMPPSSRKPKQYVDSGSLAYQTTMRGEECTMAKHAAFDFDNTERFWNEY